MSGGQRLPLSVIKPIAERIRDRLAPGCQAIELAGSLRRGAASIGDIELVAIPAPARLRFGIPAERQKNALESILAELVDSGQIRQWPIDLARAAWGPKYKKFWIAAAGRWIQVDLFVASGDNFGAQVMIRTGSATFSRAMVTHIRYKTPFVQDDGYLKRQADGAIVPVPTERAYFDAVGVEWIPPAQRNGPADLVIARDFQAPGRDQLQDTQSGGQLALF